MQKLWLHWKFYNRKNFKKKKLKEKMKRFLILLAILFIAGCVQEKMQGGEGMPDLSGKKILMVIAPNNFRDEEYFTPREVLENANASVFVTSLEEEAVSVAGKTVTVDFTLDKASVDDYDAIVFVGGPGAAVYFDNEKAISLAKDFYEAGKVVAAICIAPSVLANAGILEGKKATAWPSEQGNLEAHGATYTGEQVTVDGRIVTGKNPTAAQEFGNKIAEILAKQ